MEENVALDSSKQKQFVKSIKGIKKILKKKNKTETPKENIKNVQRGKVKKPNRKKRGLVYLSHIPHGFYEHQMTEYFKQFGVVTNARVIRSKRTGMSKGHAFVEFRDPNVAQIVAETMNNYLMGKRLIKAAIIPPEKQRRFAKRKHWNAQTNPGSDLRQKMKKLHNSVKDEKEELKIARKLLFNLNKTKKRLRELDIDYDFFVPVDVPEPLINEVELKKEDIKSIDLIKKEKKTQNKIKKEVNANTNDKEKKGKIISNVNLPPPKQANASSNTKSKKSKESKFEKNVVKELKDDHQSKITKTNCKVSKAQKEKEKHLKDKGVNPPNFIQIQNESDDESDSSVEFDSDEYNKILEESDSDLESDGISDEDLNEDITSDEDAGVENDPSPPKKVEKNSKIKPQARENKQQAKKLTTTKLQSKSMKGTSQNVTSSKKHKFEKKGNKKTLSKVIKKKK